MTPYVRNESRTFSKNEHYSFTRNKGLNYGFSFDRIMKQEYGHININRYDRDHHNRYEREFEFNRCGREREDERYDDYDRGYNGNYGQDRGNGGGSFLPMLIGAFLGFLGMSGANNKQNNKIDNKNDGADNRNNGVGNRGNGVDSDSKAEAGKKAKTETEVKAKSEAEAKAKSETEAKAKAEAEAKAKAEAEAKAKAATTAYKVIPGDTLTKIIAGKHTDWSQEQIQDKVTEIIDNEDNKLGTYEANFGQMILPGQIIDI